MVYWWLLKVRIKGMEDVKGPHSFHHVDTLDLSTLEQLPCGNGGLRWLWKHKKLKGAVHFMLPSGELRLQGSKEQQLHLLGKINGFTDPWTGPLDIPKVCLDGHAWFFGMSPLSRFMEYV